MLSPLPDIFLVMGAEVFPILGAEVVLRPALIVVVAIVCVPSLILRSAAIISGPVLRHSCARESHQSGSQHDSTYIFVDHIQ
jgi:hypothetical protein